jgi:cell division protein FtsB
MHDFRRRRQFRRALFSPFSVALLSVLVLLLGRGVWNIFEKERLATGDAQAAGAQLAELRGREAALLRDIERLRSPRGSEEEIRKRFGAAKEGEGMIIIVDAEKRTSVEVATSTGLWQKFLEWF